jgi:WD40 repeat protein
VRDIAGEKPREFASSGFTWFGLVAFAPDGKHLLSSLAEYGSDPLALTALATREPVRLFWGADGRFTSVAFSPDGQLLAAGNENGRVRLWTVGGRLVRVLDGHQGPVWSLSFAPDGKTLATAGQDGTARLWELATGKERARLRGHRGRSGFGFRPGEVAFAHNGDTLRGHRGSVFAVAFAPDGATLATGGSDGRALLWKLSALGQTEVAP